MAYHTPVNPLIRIFEKTESEVTGTLTAQVQTDYDFPDTDLVATVRTCFLKKGEECSVIKIGTNKYMLEAPGRWLSSVLIKGYFDIGESRATVTRCCPEGGKIRPPKAIVMNIIDLPPGLISKTNLQSIVSAFGDLMDVQVKTYDKGQIPVVNVTVSVPQESRIPNGATLRYYKKDNTQIDYDLKLEIEPGKSGRKRNLTKRSSEEKKKQRINKKGRKEDTDSKKAVPVDDSDDEFLISRLNRGWAVTSKRGNLRFAIFHNWLATNK